MVLVYSLCLRELGFGYMICLVAQGIWKKTPSWVTRLQSAIINIKFSINESGRRFPKNSLLLLSRPISSSCALVLVRQEHVYQQKQ